MFIKSILLLIIIILNICFGKDEFSFVFSDSNLVIQYYNRGLEFSNNDYYEKATEDLHKGIALLESKQPYLDLDSKYSLMKYYKLVGRNYRKLNDFKKSKEYFNKALKIGKEEFPDSLQTLRIDIGLGRLHFKNSGFEKAKKHFDLAYKNLLAHPEYSNLDTYHNAIATIYNDLGRLFYRQSLYEKANEYYQKSLTQELNSPELDTLYTALMYNNMGNIAHQIGDLDKALEFYDRSIQIKYVHQKDFNSVFRTRCNIGKVYTDKGEYKKALLILKEADLELLQYDRCDTTMLAWNYNNIGNALKGAKKYKSAIYYYNKALKVYKKIYGNRNYMIIKGLLNIGDCYFESGEYKKSLHKFEESLVISKDIFGEVHSDVAGAYYRIGKIYEKKDKYKKAVRQYKKAIQAIRYKFFDFSNENIIDAPFYLKLLEVKADLLNKMYKKSNKLERLFLAFRNYEAAFQLLEKMQIGFKNDGSKFILAQNANQMYGKAVKIAVELYRNTNNKEFKNNAFQFAEMNKANTLLQKLYLSDARKFSEIPEDLINKEDSLKVKLTILDTELKLIKYNRNKFRECRIQKIEKNYFALKESLENLRKKFEKKYPKYYSLKYRSRIINTDDIRLKLDGNTAIVQYLIAKDELFFFVITDEDFDILSVNLKKEYAKEISSLLEGITKRNFNIFTQSAFSLYNQLFRPIENYIKGKNNIIIIPDAEIGSVPFEALLVRGAEKNQIHNYHKLHYLVRDYNIAYHLSTNLLFSEFNKSKKNPKYDYLGFAPNFNKSNKNASVVSVLQSGFSPANVVDKYRNPLPYSLEEVREIKQKFKSSYGFGKWVKSLMDKNYLKIFSGITATEENFKNFNYSEYKFLHFATHCIIDKNIPELSGLILANGNGNEDGVLYLNEIYNLKINADLVTLSACETAKGKWVNGEGVIGLTRGFIYAGAKNLLVSFWKVNDYSTSHFMKNYYSKIIDGNTKGNSLRKTKLEMIDSGFDFAMPYYWASFKLIGKTF